MNELAFELTMYRINLFVLTVLLFWSSGCSAFRSAWSKNLLDNAEPSQLNSGPIHRIAFQSVVPHASLDINQQAPTSPDHDLRSPPSTLDGLQSLGDFAKEIRPEPPNEQYTILKKLAKDQWRFYSTENAIPMALVFGAGAAVANTQLDSQLQRHFRSSVLGASTDEWFEKLHAGKELGNGRFTLPLFGAAWLAKEWLDGPPAVETIGTWGERSMRGFLVGAGPVIAGQYVTGGSRPSELEKSSYWHPFQDSNGVSGHAFMSALPFITAAKMTDNPFAKVAFYSGSTIGPLSRMNDNAHYPSQIGIGWCMAYLSATAIEYSDSNRPGWSLRPLVTNSGSGLAAEYTW